jgi:hypothetical protein
VDERLSAGLLRAEVFRRRITTQPVKVIRQVPRVVIFRKSTFAQSLNLIEVGAVKAAAGCDITQSSQIAYAQTPLNLGSLPAARELNHDGQSDKE